MLFSLIQYASTSSWHPTFLHSIILPYRASRRSGVILQCFLRTHLPGMYFASCSLRSLKIQYLESIGFHLRLYLEVLYLPSPQPLVMWAVLICLKIAGCHHSTQCLDIARQYSTSRYPSISPCVVIVPSWTYQCHDTVPRRRRSSQVALRFCIFPRPCLESCCSS